MLLPKTVTVSFPYYIRSAYHHVHIKTLKEVGAEIRDGENAGLLRRDIQMPE